MKRNCSGFTLVELLLAATLSALVLTGAFASLSVVLQAYKNQAGKSNTADTARLVLERMRIDLLHTFFSPHSETTRFVGMDQSNGLLQNDTLTFISTVNNPQETGPGTSDLVEVQYYIDQDETTPEKWLVRRYDATPDMDPFSGGEISLLGPKVFYLEIQYFDGYTWWPSWDSSEAIPLAVHITLGLFNPEQMDEEPTPESMEEYSTTVWLPRHRQMSEEEGMIAAMGMGDAGSEVETPEEQQSGGGSGQGGQGGAPGGGAPMGPGGGGAGGR